MPPLEAALLCQQRKSVCWSELRHHGPVQLDLRGGGNILYLDCRTLEWKTHPAAGNGFHRHCRYHEPAEVVAGGL